MNDKTQPLVEPPPGSEPVNFEFQKGPLRILIIESDIKAQESMHAMIADGLKMPHRQTVVSCLGEGLTIMEEQHVDVVLLDLSLPDIGETEGISTIRKRKRDTAIIVVANAQDDGMIARCFEAGAQDFVLKSDLSSRLLGRVVGYALFRIRDRQLSELSQNLDQYRALSSAGSATKLADRMTGGGPLSERMPSLFESMSEDYRRVIKAYMRYLAVFKDKPVQEMERLATLIDDQGGGPRDLMDIHVFVIDEALQRADGETVRSMTTESRLVALEMMGMLVNYYRTGVRRR